MCITFEVNTTYYGFWVTIIFCFKCLRFCYLTFSNRKDGMCTGGVYPPPPHKGNKCAPPRKFGKEIQKKASPAISDIFFLYFQYSVRDEPLHRSHACYRSIEPSWKHWIFTSNYRCPHTGVPYNTVYGWNRPSVKAQCSLFTYKLQLYQPAVHS